jgi:subtilisin family serine protease
MPIREKSKITGSLQADIESSNHLSYSVDDQPYLGRVEVDAQTGAFSYSLNPESSTPTDNYNHDRFSIAIKKANQLIATEAIRVQINTDPEYKDQWQLDGYRRDYYTGEIRKGWHINIAEPISDGLTGQGVIVAVVDDGMREDPDLEFDKQNSWDFNDNDSNVADAKRFRVTPVATGFHGTKVGKALAATGWNNTGGRGVAPGVTVRAYLGGRPDSFGAHHKTKDVDIFNMSYITNSIANGIDSAFEQHLWYALSEPNACDMDKNGRTECPWTQKYKQGLRDGKGAIHTAGAGNSFKKTIGFGLMEKACVLAYKYQLPCQTTIIDSSRNHPALIAVASTNKGGVATWSNHGPANWISAPSRNGISTSLATPRVAGVVALMLEANPELSWRDVKYILANSARQVDNDKYKLHRVRGEVTVDGILVEPGWITNQAVRQWDPEKSAWQQPNGGYKFHNAYGFGLVDGAAAVTMAKNYPENHLGDFIKYPERSNKGFNHKLQTRTPYQYTISQPSDGLAEAVRVKVKVDYDYITDLSIILESPSGTQSTLLTPFNGTRHIEEGKYLELSSNAFYGESIQGDWTLKIFDHLDDNTDADKHDPLTDDNYCKNFDEDFRCVPPITGNAQFKGWKLLLYGRDKPAE